MIPEVAERREELEALCRRFQVARLELFGTAATASSSNAARNLDFLVEFDASATGRGYADRYFGLLEGLQELFDREIDLVVASAIRNPYFRESVERTKTLLYAA